MREVFWMPTHIYILFFCCFQTKLIHIYVPSPPPPPPPLAREKSKLVPVYIPMTQEANPAVNYRTLSSTPRSQGSVRARVCNSSDWRTVEQKGIGYRPLLTLSLHNGNFIRDWCLIYLSGR